VYPKFGATVMPVFPLHKIAWPGTTVKIKVSQPGHVRMYDDLVLSGKRHLVATLSCTPEDTTKPAAEDGRLSDIGTVLFIESLIPVSNETDGLVKYIAVHSVVGRARLGRLLNPSALFEPEVDYLRAEVTDLLQMEPELQDDHVDELANTDLFVTLDQVRELADRLGEPVPEIKSSIVHNNPQMSTWQLTLLWQNWRVAAMAHRERECSSKFFPKEWIDEQLKQHRRMSEDSDIEEALWRSQDVLADVDIRSDFWEPFLRILTTDDRQARSVLVLDMVQNEIKMLQARLALRSLQR